MNKLIKNIFVCLVFFLPLMFSFSTSELFELPKIILVYLSTILLTTFHMVNFALGQKPLFKKDRLTIPLILFLLSQTISTIFSIDRHMSFWGYYSRFNGGLLSTICYILLHQIVIIYIDKKFTQKIIKTTLFSSFLVCLYAIGQHFGIDKHLWIQDVQSRVFSTLGQPNWLAAYLVIVISLLLSQTHRKPPKNIPFYCLLFTVYYLSLLFTKSKSGIFAVILPLTYFFLKNLKQSARQLIPFIIIVAISTFTFDNPIRQKILPATTTVNNQPSLNITPSQDIRLIVWQGAIDLFKKFPIIGTGTETFAISYYWTRPVAHNLTSEWDFLYNKAHNEFLHMAATTGIIGLTTYLFLVITVIIHLKSQPYFLLAYLTILITNFAGFSVVVTSFYFFILPALTKDNQHPDQNRPAPPKKIWLLIPICLLFIYSAFSLFSFCVADLKYSQSKKLYQATNLSASLSSINIAIALRPNQPEFLIQQADILSQIALAKNDPGLIIPAVKALSLAENISPFHLNYLKKSAQILFNLSSLDASYLSIGINTIKKATILAPTDAKSFYVLSQFYQHDNQTDLAIQSCQQAIKLKPNYDHAYFRLGQLHYLNKNYSQALDSFQTVLMLAPTNQDAQSYIDKIKSIESSRSTILPSTIL